MRKSQFLLRLRNEREKWEHVMNYVGASRVGIGGVSGAWSTRDVLAHVMAHEQYLADRLQQIQQGEALPPCQSYEELETFFDDFGYPDFESSLLTEQSANAWVIEKYKNTPFKDLIVLELHAYDSIYESVMTLSEQQLEAHNLFPVIADYTYKHYQQHAADIRKRFKNPVKS